MSSEIMNEPSWSTLPVLAILRIFDNLNYVDRVNASSTCAHWRQPIYKKRYFKNVTYSLDLSDDEKCEYFCTKIWNLAKGLIITIDIEQTAQALTLAVILMKVVKSDTIKSIRFYTNKTSLFEVYPLRKKKKPAYPNYDIEGLLLQPLRLIFARDNVEMEVLDFGAIEMLVYYSMDLLESMTHPNNLRELTLATVKYSTRNYIHMNIDIPLVIRSRSLQVLSLDFDMLSNEMLVALGSLPLKKLLINVHRFNSRTHDIEDDNWMNFASIFNNIVLIVTFLCASQYALRMRANILRPSMPITHLRILFCNYVNPSTLEYVSWTYRKTLRSVQMIDRSGRNDIANLMRVRFNYRGQDQFVMMAWRCEHLEELVIHGHTMDPHNLMGIARLRGHTLKRYEVSQVDAAFTRPTLLFMFQEISNVLKYSWSPKHVNTLHPALRSTHENDGAARDDFVYDLMRKDLCNDC